MIFRALLMAAMLILVSCGDEQADCTADMAAFEQQYGQPEQVTAVEQDGRLITTWWYYRRGFARSFEFTSGSCVVQDDTFPPFRRMVDYILPDSMVNR